MGGIHLVEIIPESGDMNQSVGHGLRQLNEHAVIAHIHDNRLKEAGFGLGQFTFEELQELDLDAFAFCLGAVPLSDAQVLGKRTKFRKIVVFPVEVAASWKEIAGKDPVHD